MYTVKKEAWTCTVGEEMWPKARNTGRTWAQRRTRCCATREAIGLESAGGFFPSENVP